MSPRSLVAVLLALTTAACALDGGGSQMHGPTSPATSPTTASPSATPGRPPSPTAATPRTTPSPAPATPPPTPAPYRPARNEVHPGPKRVAAQVAQQLTTYEPGTPAAELAGAVTRHPRRQRAVAEAVRPLLQQDRWSRGRIVYPQLGGLRRNRMSVMVVVEQTVGAPGVPGEAHARTLDVRLVRQDGRWVFDTLASVGGEPVPPPPALTPTAQAVLGHPDITLPDSARWDIHAGRISPHLLQLLLDLAERTSYGVTVLSSGHPFHVFGTDRQSNHTKGRAVDIYLHDGTLVADDRAKGSATHELVRWLYRRPEVSEVGSPWALDGYGGRSFTDVVHQDHLHVGVTAEARRPPR